MTDHPAKYSKGMVPLFRDILDRRLGPGTVVVDPFAGTGRIHELRPMYGTFGVEIEAEWADMSPYTFHGDSRDLRTVLWSGASIVRFFRWRREFVDAIVTSPTYGNRMADHHEARDGSTRRTYRHVLGRPLDAANTGGMQWGEKYRDLHEQIWTECWLALRQGGLLVLNISDHYRKGEIVNVSGWHADYLAFALDMRLIEAYAVPTRRMKFGANADRRALHEYVLVFQKRYTS